MKLLVTGGAGFIGSNFIEWIFNHSPDINIINLDLLTDPQNIRNTDSFSNNLKYKFIHGDVCKEDTIKKILTNSSIDWIIHFAAETSVDKSLKDPELFIKTNIKGTNNILNSIKNSDTKLIYISTDEVYGPTTKAQQQTETTPLNPQNPYSASKAAAEMLIQSYRNCFDVKSIIIRPSNNYGKHQSFDKLIPKTIQRLLEKKNIPIYGTGEQKRDWLAVNDCCEGIWKVLSFGKIGSIYNLSSNEKLTNLFVVKKILNLLEQSESKIQNIEDRPGHDFCYSPTNFKSMRELNWKPRTSFESGIISCVNWYKNKLLGQI